MRVGSGGSIHLFLPTVCASAPRLSARLARGQLQYYTADGVCPFGVHCFYFHEAELEESPRRRSRRGDRPGGSGRGRGRPGGGGRGHGYEGGAAGLSVDVDVDSSIYIDALRVPDDYASEEDDQYFMQFALEETLELLDIASSGRGLPSGY